MAASSFYPIWLRPLYQLALTDQVTIDSFFHVTWLKWITALNIISIGYESAAYINAATKVAPSDRG